MILKQIDKTAIDIGSTFIASVFHAVFHVDVHIISLNSKIGEYIAQ
jgi:hypothetical protein